MNDLIWSGPIIYVGVCECVCVYVYVIPCTAPFSLASAEDSLACSSPRRVEMSSSEDTSWNFFVSMRCARDSASSFRACIRGLTDCGSGWGWEVDADMCVWGGRGADTVDTVVAAAAAAMIKSRCDS